MKRWSRIALYGLAGLALLAVVPWGVGLLLPAEHTASVSREVGGTPEQVWSVLTDPAGYPEWRSNVRSVDLMSGDGDVRMWREETREGAVTYRRVAAEPPGRLVVEIADDDLPYGGQWTYELEPLAEGTRVTITEDGVVHNPLFRFFSRFVFGHDATARAFLEALHTRMQEAR